MSLSRVAELIALGATSTQALDYAMVESGVSPGDWAEFRGVSEKAVTKNTDAVQEMLDRQKWVVETLWTDAPTHDGTTGPGQLALDEAQQ